MKRLITLLLLLLLAGAPSILLSQEATEEMAAAPVATFTHAAYYNCKVTDESKADAAVNKFFASIYDAALEAGTISAWGWYAHVYGGKWRRLLYQTTDSIDALIDASGELFTATREAMGDDTSFAQACPDHEDYIWQGDQTSGSGEEAGWAVMSVYFYCDQVRGGRADEIVKEHFTPVLNQQIADGKINSWAWLSHYIGGKIQRLLTVSGKDYKSLLAGRDEATTAIFERAGEAFGEFATICNSHLDYIWDVYIQKP